MMMVPDWLHILSVASLVIGFACAAAIALDERRHPQHMRVMNIVWPSVALFGTVLAVWGYFRYGRPATARGGKGHEKNAPPFPVMVGKATSHCGSGCTLGDICAEWLAFAFPTVAIWLGWRSLFGEKMFAVWIFDFILAFLFGIAFQYFTIVPMRRLTPAEGIWEAVKADTLSLAAWQIGMYGFMAFASFYLFRQLLGATLEPDSVEFWFMMQIAMLFGFVTSFPVNWWLLRAGVKAAM